VTGDEPEHSDAYIRAMAAYNSMEAAREARRKRRQPELDRLLAEPGDLAIDFAADFVRKHTRSKRRSPSGRI
jgi:hypothetical protein